MTSFKNLLENQKHYMQLHSAFFMPTLEQFLQERDLFGLVAGVNNALVYITQDNTGLRINVLEHHLPADHLVVHVTYNEIYYAGKGLLPRSLFRYSNIGNGLQDPLWTTAIMERQSVLYYAGNYGLRSAYRDKEQVFISPDELGRSDDQGASGILDFTFQDDQLYVLMKKRNGSSEVTCGQFHADPLFCLRSPTRDIPPRFFFIPGSFSQGLTTYPFAVLSTVSGLEINGHAVSKEPISAPTIVGEELLFWRESSFFYTKIKSLSQAISLALPSDVSLNGITSLSPISQRHLHDALLGKSRGLYQEQRLHSL